MLPCKYEQKQAARQVAKADLAGSRDQLSSRLAKKSSKKMSYNFVPVLPGEQWPSAMGFVDGDVGGFVLSLAVDDIADGRKDDGSSAALEKRRSSLRSLGPKSTDYRMPLLALYY